jgi:hypothetical protein
MNDERVMCRVMALLRTEPDSALLVTFNRDQGPLHVSAWAIDNSGHGITDDGFDRTSLLGILENLREDIAEMAAGRHKIPDPETNWHRP